MTTASTSTFDLQRDQIIAEALEICGAIGPGDTRDANNSKLFDSSNVSLNRLVKSIDATGQRLWRFVRRTTTTTQGTGSFTTAADVLDIDEPMTYMRSGETARTQIVEMSRDDYMRLGDRTTQGMPRQFYVEKTLTTTTVFLWQVPDATGDTIEYAAQLRGLDMTSGSQTADFTQKWGSSLVYGLVVEICAKYGQAALIDTYKPMYAEALAIAINDDTERGNMVLSPYGMSPYSCGAG